MSDIDEKIDLSVGAQWRLFRRGCDTDCPRCQALFRFAIALPWFLLPLACIIGPIAGYHVRADWRGLLGGFLVGLAVTRIVCVYVPAGIFWWIKRCAFKRFSRKD